MRWSSTTLASCNLKLLEPKSTAAISEKVGLLLTKTNLYSSNKKTKKLWCECFALHLIKSGVTNVFTFNHVDNIFSNVFRVVANTLNRFCHKQDF